MKMCPSGRSVRAGRTGSTSIGATRCLICETAALFERWRRPVFPRRKREPVAREPKPPAPRAERDRRYYERRKVRAWKEARRG